jgi:hypothetical protein
LKSEVFPKSLVANLSPLQTGTAVRAVQGGGSLQVKMLSLSIESLIVNLSPLQTGTAVRAVQGGGSLQVKMLLLRIAMSFMLWESDGLYCEHSSRCETSLSSASALDMRRHFPKLGPFPSIHAVVEPGEVACVF